MPKFAVHVTYQEWPWGNPFRNDGEAHLLSSPEDKPFRQFDVVRIFARTARLAEKKYLDSLVPSHAFGVEVMAEPWPLPIGAPPTAQIPCRFRP